MNRAPESANSEKVLGMNDLLADLEFKVVRAAKVRCSCKDCNDRREVTFHIASVADAIKRLVEAYRESVAEIERLRTRLDAASGISRSPYLGLAQRRCGATSGGKGDICERPAGHPGPHGCDVGKGEYSEWVDDHA